MIIIKYDKSIRYDNYLQISILKGAYMSGGIITAKKGVGDVYFLNNAGKEVLNSSKGVEVEIKEEFSGFSVKDALEEAKKYAIGAIQKKVAQKMRGFDCYPVVKDIKINYKIKFGFAAHTEKHDEAKATYGVKVANKLGTHKKSQ
jgi:hypothetical protein